MANAKQERDNLARKTPTWVAVMLPILSALITALILLVLTGVVK